MRKTIVGLSLAAVVGSGWLLSGCTIPGMPAGTDTTTTEKSGDTTKTGTIMKAGELYFLNEPDSNKPLAIDTYSVDLAQYVGKRVKVTGQYSGDTLFVGKIELAQNEKPAFSAVPMSSPVAQ